MLEDLTIESFAPRVGEAFRVTLDGHPPIDLVLQTVVEVTFSGWQPADIRVPRQPFTLTFIGPPDIVLPQRIYSLDNAALGLLELFVVPIARDARGVTYEVIFS